MMMMIIKETVSREYCAKVLLTNYRRRKEQFDSIFDPEVHNSLVARLAL